MTNTPRCGALDPKNNACTYDAGHQGMHFAGKGFHWVADSRAKAKPKKPTTPEPLDDGKRCGVMDPKGRHACNRDQGHVGVHSNGQQMWKDAQAKKPACADTMAGIACTLPKGHPGDHVGDGGTWTRDRVSARFDCAPDRDERESDPAIEVPAGIADRDIKPENETEDQDADELDDTEMRVLSRQQREDREAHAAEVESTALVQVDAQAAGMLSVERARDFLEKSLSVDEVRDVADKAKAVALYLRSRDASIESQNDAAEIRLRAERRLGQLLDATPKAKGTRLAGRNVGGPVVQPPKNDPPTLADQGIKRTDAAKWQQIAKIPEKKFEALVEETKSKGQRLTTSAPLKMVRQEAKAQKAADLRAQPVPPVTGRFNVIVIDPPWKYDKRAEDITQRGQGDYPRMELEAIKALPVADRAEENCILWCWVTNAFLRQAYECLDAWGFVEKSVLTWAKGHFGNGDWLRGQTEHCIMAVRGSPIVTLTNQSTLLEGELREHSRKPESFYELVEALCPGTKLEMFSQTPRDGWAMWGSDTQKYEAA